MSDIPTFGNSLSDSVRAAVQDARERRTCLSVRSLAHRIAAEHGCDDRMAGMIMEALCLEGTRYRVPIEFRSADDPAPGPAHA